MKLYFLIKLLIIILVIGQTTAVDLTGKTLVKNFTSTAAFSVYNLGKFAQNDSTINIKYLTSNQAVGYLFYYYGIDSNTGLYATLNDNTSSISSPKIGSVSTVQITKFDQEVFLALTNYRIPKFTVNITNSKGVEYIPQDKYGPGNQNGFSSLVRFFMSKNDCTIFVDRSIIRPLNYKHTVQFNYKAFSKQLTLADQNVTMSITAGSVVNIQIGLNQSMINITNFTLELPIYSPSSGAKCQLDQVYDCGSGTFCKIFNGEKCGGVDGITCIKSCGDNIIDTDAGEKCDGGPDCGTDCIIKCGNGKIDDGELCDGGPDCGTDCKFICGNGKTEAGEVCDGGADCSADCKSLCGNGILEPAEKCDNEKLQGCVDCKIVPGYRCPLVNEKSVCQIICKTNGIFEVDEGCDNGDDPGCKNCTVVPPYKCSNTLGKPSYCYVCGNSKLEMSEQCDNGNKTGCINCKLDRGYDCQIKRDDISKCQTICGDGQWYPGEECDNGNETGCINCMMSPDFTCKNTIGSISYCTKCGNFEVEWPEQCDNNNVNGCKNCVIQPGWDCRLNPNYCFRTVEVCGNGERQLLEQCDDGNKVDGDGCNSKCKREVDYTCSNNLGEKSICNSLF